MVNVKNPAAEKRVPRVSVPWFESRVKFGMVARKMVLDVPGSIGRADLRLTSVSCIFTCLVIFNVKTNNSEIFS